MISVVGVLLIIYTKTMKREEVVEIMTSDMVWMIAGMLAMSSALSSSGAGEAIGNFVLKILGENPSGLKVLTVFNVSVGKWFLDLFGFRLSAFGSYDAWKENQKAGMDRMTLYGGGRAEDYYPEMDCQLEARQ